MLSSGDKKDVSNKINIDVITEFIAKLNMDNNMFGDNEHILGRDNCMHEHALFNEPFTVCEVTHYIINFKCNKASGSDLFVN